MLPYFPPLGHNSSQRHGRNTGRLRKKSPERDRQTDTHAHAEYFNILTKLLQTHLSVLKHLKILVKSKEKL